MGAEVVMITSWELYLWTRLDGFQILFIGLASVSLLVAFVTTIEEISGWLPYRKYMVAITMFFAFLAVLMPSKKDAAMIWVIPKLATVENVELLQGEAAEIYKLAKQALKESVGVEDEK
jgi:hypothetical protein